MQKSHLYTEWLYDFNGIVATTLGMPPTQPSLLYQVGPRRFDRGAQTQAYAPRYHRRLWPGSRLTGYWLGLGRHSLHFFPGRTTLAARSGATPTRDREVKRGWLTCAARLKRKKATLIQSGFFILMVLWRLPTLPGLTQVSSAVLGLTSLFGMGRGEHQANSHQQDFLLV